MGDSSSKFSHASPAVSYQRLSQQEVQELLSSFGLNEFSPAKARISLHSFLRIFPPVLHPTASVLLPVLRDLVRLQQLQGRGYSSSGFLNKADSNGQLAPPKVAAQGGSRSGGLKTLGTLACSGKGARKGEETCCGGTHITLQEMVDAVSACAYGDREELQVHMLQRLLSRMSKVLEEQCKRLRQQQSGAAGSRHHPERGVTSHSHHLGAGLFSLHHGGTSASTGSLTSETTQTASVASVHGAPGAPQPSSPGPSGVSSAPVSGVEAVLHQIFISAYLLFLAIISPSNPIFSSADPFALSHPAAGASSPPAGSGDHSSGLQSSAGEHAACGSASPRGHRRASGVGSPGVPSDSDADHHASHGQSRPSVSGAGMAGWDTTASSAAVVSLPLSTPLDFSFLLNAFAASGSAALGSNGSGVQLGASGGAANSQGFAGAGFSGGAAGARGTAPGAGPAPPAAVALASAPAASGQALGDKGTAGGNASGAQMTFGGASKQQQQEALLWILHVLPVLPTLFVSSVSHFLLGASNPDDGALNQKQPTLQYQVYAPRRRGTAGGSPRRGSRARASLQMELPRSPSLETLCQNTGGWRGEGPLEGISKIFTDETAVMLRLSSMLFAFPPLVPWQRLYSSWKQGASFNRICSSVFFYDAPTVLVIKTKHGPVLGAMISSEWKDAGHVYIGDSNCFLFSLEPQFQVIRPSGLGRNFVYINVKNQFYPRGIGFGGQPGCFRLWLDDEFQNCYCTKSDATYGPGVLLPPRRSRLRHQGDSQSSDSISSGIRYTQSLPGEGKDQDESVPAPANGAQLSGALAPEACGDTDVAGHEDEPDAFHMPFEVLEVEVWGCGDAASRQQQHAANKRQEQLRQERRQVDKGRFAQNEFDREFLLENTFNRAKGADARST
uniref:Oxidation resistance protein 1 n=1 Tax=Neospora caninum (strain Liverpool) TaxID=572307 RepID=A0A0F7U7W2_NEOCL|nr:TPA: TLD domain-containing protein, putative [Neospora caninum Liverpool]